MVPSIEVDGARHPVVDVRHRTPGREFPDPARVRHIVARLNVHVLVRPRNTPDGAFPHGAHNGFRHLSKGCARAAAHVEDMADTGLGDRSVNESLCQVFHEDVVTDLVSLPEHGNVLPLHRQPDKPVHH